MIRGVFRGISGSMRSYVYSSHLYYYLSLNPEDQPNAQTLTDYGGGRGGLKRSFINYFFIWRFALANIILAIKFMPSIY